MQSPLVTSKGLLPHAPRHLETLILPRIPIQITVTIASEGDAASQGYICRSDGLYMLLGQYSLKGLPPMTWPFDFERSR